VIEPDSSRTVFEGTLISVVIETWGSNEREVVRHPGAAAIVALTPSKEVVLVRQMRQAVRQDLLEIPAGILDVSGETSEECARRELAEETGYRASSVTHLASILTSPGFADERIDLFLARDVEPGGEATDDGVEAVLMSFDEAVEAIGEGRIRDAKTVTGLLLATRR
jgi:ADP-ribose pyrophosphatase